MSVRSFLCLFLYFNKTLLRKTLEWSSLVPGPEAKSSLEITNPTLFTVSYHHGGGDHNPVQNSCLESTLDRAAWKSIVHGGIKVSHDWITERAHTHTHTHNFKQEMNQWQRKLLSWLCDTYLSKDWNFSLVLTLWATRVWGILSSHLCYPPPPLLVTLFQLRSVSSF